MLFKNIEDDQTFYAPDDVMLFDNETMSSVAAQESSCGESEESMGSGSLYTTEDDNDNIEFVDELMMPYLSLSDVGHGSCFFHSFEEKTVPKIPLINTWVVEIGETIGNEEKLFSEFHERQAFKSKQGVGKKPYQDRNELHHSASCLSKWK